MLIAALLAIVIVFIYISNANLTGETIVDEHYSFTKAICNETNYCQDYEITCKNGELTDINPLTGAAIQNPSNWQDPRNQTTRDKLCE